MDPSRWETVYALGDGAPAVLARRYGRGSILVDMAGLYQAAIGKGESAITATRRLVEYMSRDKQVAALQGGGGWQFSDGYRWELIETTDDGLRIHHNEYTRMYVANDVRAYKEAVL